MARKAKGETREKVKDAAPVEIGGRMYQATRRVTYRHTEDGVNVVSVHTTLRCLTRNPDGSRRWLTEIHVTASGEPDAVRAYFAVSRGAVFTEDGRAGSNLFTL